MEKTKPEEYDYQAFLKAHPEKVWVGPEGHVSKETRLDELVKDTRFGFTAEQVGQIGKILNQQAVNDFQAEIARIADMRGTVTEAERAHLLKKYHIKLEGNYTQDNQDKPVSESADQKIVNNNAGKNINNQEEERLNTETQVQITDRQTEENENMSLTPERQALLFDYAIAVVNRRLTLEKIGQLSLTADEKLWLESIHNLFTRDELRYKPRAEDLQKFFMQYQDILFVYGGNPITEERLINIEQMADAYSKVWESAYYTGAKARGAIDTLYDSEAIQRDKKLVYDLIAKGYNMPDLEKKIGEHS